MGDGLYKIDAIEKAEICKRRMIKTFNYVYKKENNSKIAFDKALENLNINIEKMLIKNIRQIAGLKGELIYYYKNFMKQSLSTEMAVGYKGDYRGIINDKPSIIDVTTNPLYKKNIEINGELVNGWDYYIGVVNIKQEIDKLYPLLLPKSKDNNISFFILVYESNKDSAATLYGEISDQQYMIKYDPYCGGMDEDSFELIESYNYMTSSPSSTRRYIHDSYTDIWNYNDGNPKSTEKFLNKYRKQVENEYLEKLNKDVMFFNKLNNLTISAVVESVDHWYSKDNVEPVSQIMWSHPHKFIRKELGKEGDILDYDVAGVLYDTY